ncbi:MAG: hypothetical protein IRY99_07990 [Isosphaeraceae bacterium]|nr:hypothetical protein [Isosphaeraceae bacterium]
MSSRYRSAGICCSSAPLLDRYRDQLCTLSDDIQGTAAITTGTLLAAVGVTGGWLRDQHVAILGAGPAGCGVAEQLVAAGARALAGKDSVDITR